MARAASTRERASSPSATRACFRATAITSAIVTPRPWRTMSCGSKGQPEYCADPRTESPSLSANDAFGFQEGAGNVLGFLLFAVDLVVHFGDRGFVERCADPIQHVG